MLRIRCVLALAFALLLIPTAPALAATWYATVPGSGTTCTTGTPCSLAQAVTNSASSGDTIKLKTASFGNWTGTTKAVTITADSGASPSISFGDDTTSQSLSSSTSWTADGTLGGGTITATYGHLVGSTTTARNITLKNITWTGPLVIDGPTNSAIMVDGGTFNNQTRNASCTDEPARIHLSYTAGSSSGVTVKNATFDGGDRDGIQTGSALTIGPNNTFANIEEDTGDDCQHSDPIQGVGATGVTVTGNLVYSSADGIVDFDESASWSVTNNVCYDIARGACVTLYSDDASTVEHNTGGSGVDALELDKKSAQSAGSGTVFRNNVGALANNGQGVATNTNNLFSGASAPNINGTPTFAGGATPTTYAGYALSCASDGVNSATDGTNVGAITGSEANCNPTQFVNDTFSPPALSGFVIDTFS